MSAPGVEFEGPKASALEPTGVLLSADREVRLAQDMEAGTAAEVILAICPMTYDERDAWRASSVDSLTVEILRARHNHSKNAGLTRLAEKEATEKVDQFIQLTYRQGTVMDDGVIALEPETALSLRELVALKRAGFDEFWVANQGLVRTAAYKKKGLGMLWDELVDEVATAGLMRAILKFDYTKGYKFSTYAVPWLDQAARRAVEHNNRTKGYIEESTSAERTTVLRTTDALWQVLGRHPSVEEVADELGVGIEVIERALEIPRGTLYLDAELIYNTESSGSTAGDKIDADQPGPEDIACTDDLLRSLDRLLAHCLSEERAAIVRLRLGLNTPDMEGMEFTKIGARYGYQEAWARQNYNAAVDILRYVAGQKMRHPPNKRMHTTRRHLALLRFKYGEEAKLLAGLMV